MSEITHSVRWLFKKPIFSGVCVGTIALAISIHTVIFSLADMMLFQPVGVESPERLVKVSLSTQSGETTDTFSYPAYRMLQQAGDGTISLAATSISPVSVSLGKSSRLSLGRWVSPDYFRVLGARPLLGQLYRSASGDDAATPAGSGVVISYRFWRKYFDSDPEIVGSPLRINGEPVTVMGVVPRSFRGFLGGIRIEIWLPLSIPSGLQPRENLNDARSSWLELVGRVEGERTLEQGEAILGRALVALGSTDLVDRTDKRRVLLKPLGSVPDPLRGQIRLFVGLLICLATVLLTIASLNVASLLLARSMSDVADMSVRLALGATRGSLIRRRLYESLLLFVVGGGLGLGLARGMIETIRRLELPVNTPLEIGLEISGRVVLVAWSATLVCGLIAALVPALRVSHLDPASLLNARHGPTPAAGRWRSAFVAVQIGGALAMLVVCSLFLRSLRQVSAIDPGFNHRSVLMLSYDLSYYRFSKEEGRRFFLRLAESLQALEGVNSVAASQVVPLGLDHSMASVNVPGHDPPQGQRPIGVDRNIVTETFFRNLDIPLLLGRAFDERDRSESRPVAIVNETMARRFWPDENPVGRVFYMGSTAIGKKYEVVGVVPCTKYRTLIEKPRLAIYLPFAQRYSERMTILIRSSGPTPDLSTKILSSARSVDPDVSMTLRSLSDHIRTSLLPQRIVVSASGIFGVLGALLAILGVYGVTVFVFRQRVHEMGVRLALGASRGDLCKMILEYGFRVSLVGAVPGLVTAFLMSRVLSDWLYGVGSFDLRSYVGSTLILLSVLLSTAYLSARKVMRIDPADSLRWYS